ncbi:MAG: hypothetical protein WC455_30160 [Dehalococcoidia bacterium]|jgi:hypothetical protein
MFQVLQAVVELKNQHSETWRDKPESYWLARLMEEVGEAGAAFANDHDDPLDWELMQIAAICLNWLEMRAVYHGEYLCRDLLVLHNELDDEAQP